MKKTRLITTMLIVSLLAGLFVGVFAMFSSAKNTDAEEVSFGDVFEKNEYVTTEDYALSPSYHKVQKRGLKVSCKRRTVIKYKKVINLNDNTIDVPLFSVLFTPEKEGAFDMSGMYIYLRDCFDPNNVLTFNIYNPGANWPKESCVSIYGSNQAEYLMRWQSYYSSIAGSNDAPFTCYFDYENLSVYTSPNGSGGKSLTRDLTAGPITDVSDTANDGAWTGFKTGYCTLEFEPCCQGGSGDFMLLNVDGVDFTKEKAEASDDVLDLLIDYNGYTADTLPFGIKGMKYPVLDCDCYSLFGGNISKVTPIVVKENGDVVPVEDGYFETDTAGTYFMLYEGVNKSGNSIKRRIKINVLENYEQEINYTFNSAIPSEGKVDDVILLPVGDTEGGSGKLTYVNKVLDSDGKEVVLINENDCDIFIPTKADTYKLTSYVSDFLGTSKTFEKTITIANNPDVINVNTVPKAVKAGSEFIIPSYTCKTADTVKVYINDVENTTGKFTATGSSFELKYKAGAYEETYIVKVVNIESVKGFMKDYVITENGGEVEVKDGGLLLKSSGTDARFTFLNKISKNALELSFNLFEDKANYERITFYVKDAENPDNEIEYAVERRDNGFYIIYNDTESVKLSAEYYSVVGLLNYVNDSRTITEADGVSIATINKLTNGRAFNGFGDYVYLTIEFTGATGDAEFLLASISNQIFNNKAYDTTKPILYYDNAPAYATAVRVGDTLTLSKVYGYDVLQEKVETKVRVTYSSNGSPEQEVYVGAGDEGKQFCFDKVGTYYVYYSATDSEDNEVSSRKTVYSLDTVAPTIELGAHELTAKLTEDYVLPIFTATDNNPGVKSYIIICYDTGYEELAKGEKYRFKLAGIHTVRIISLDADDNCTAIEYKVEVK